jgi:NitT/TauT family transport system substrate-binding protein
MGRPVDPVRPASTITERRLPTKINQSRRDFLAGLSVAGTASVLGTRASLAEEGPPEVTTIRLRKSSAICLSPRYLAGDLLRAEGFTDIRYVSDLPLDAVAHGELDFEMQTAAWVVSELDAGKPITAMAGVHLGCYELFAHEPIRAISDLRGKKVGIPQKPGSSGHLLLASIAAYVGLDRTPTSTGCATRPATSWSRSPNRKSMRFSASPRASGAARPQDWPRDPQHEHGQAMVAVLLLYRDGQQGLCPQLSGRQQARAACVPQSHRHLRHRA